MDGNAVKSLENLCIERDMPAGYTWVKFRSCWTSEPGSGRFFPEQKNENSGNLMPAAYFCSLIVYDPAASYHERDVKFQGDEAVAMQAYSQRGLIVRIDAEGHLVTKARQQPDGYVARSTVFIKQGTLKVLEECMQTPAQAMPAGIPEASGAQARAAADLRAGLAAELEGSLTELEIEPLEELSEPVPHGCGLGVEDVPAAESLWPTLTALAAELTGDSAVEGSEHFDNGGDECPF